MRALVVALFIVVACGTPGSPPATAQTPAAQHTPGISQPPSTTESPTGAPQSPIAVVGSIQELRSAKSRNPAGPNRLGGLDILAAADAEFAFDLYQEIAAHESGNLFFSPYSISAALSMALAGARGNTAAEIGLTLGAGEDEAAWHDARNKLDLALSSLDGRSQPHEGEAQPMTLEPTNSIFGQSGYAFRDEFLDLLAADYGAGMQAVDFGSDPEAARKAINAWVAERTRDRIEELLEQGSITDLTRAALVNVIYFKANWYSQFDPESTTTDPFQGLDGSVSDVQMMHSSPEAGYANGPGWAAVQLPYWGTASMIVVVPDEGEFDEIESKFDATFVADLNARLTEHEVELSLPRWESESSLSLTPMLKNLGIHDAFDRVQADLSGMADFDQTGERLYVGGVVHQANITVDEEGTEAAAATAVLVVATCDCGPPPATLTVDRPFIYLIRDDVTNEILFVGRLLEP